MPPPPPEAQHSPPAQTSPRAHCASQWQSGAGPKSGMQEPLTQTMPAPQSHEVLQVTCGVHWFQVQASP